MLLTPQQPIIKTLDDVRTRILSNISISDAYLTTVIVGVKDDSLDKATLLELLSKARAHLRVII